jgi:hypothetical protein
MAKTPGTAAGPEDCPGQPGQKIGMEWCRANAVRKVNSSMLKSGAIFSQHCPTNPQQLASAIAFIDQKVDAVLD